MMNNNPFSFICNLLTQLSNYTFKINEIILEINNILNNQMNNPMLNQNNILMGQMNLMNFENKFNYNMNPLNNDIIPQEPFEIKYYNVKFETKTGLRTLIKAEKNLTLNELLTLYFKKINKPEFINNYKWPMKFLFNANCLEEQFSKETKIKDIFTFNINPNIIVFESN